jgi:hypothetical protein
MAKYREGRADIRERESWTMQFPKPNHPVCLDQGSTSAIGSSSNKRSRTPSQRNSESWDCCQREYHSVPYFPVGPPMPRPWGPLPMMFPICPLWVGWYRPWALLPMHFHLEWSGPARGFGHGGYHAGDNRYGSVSQHQDRRSQGQQNWTVQNPKPNRPLSTKRSEASR